MPRFPAIAVAIALATSGLAIPAQAVAKDKVKVNDCSSVKNPKCQTVKAPEIDAASGVQAIALLGGMLLLVGERARRRRT